MKYKIRYTLIVFLMCGLLSWALVYELQHPEELAKSAPVRTITHLIAPRSSPRPSATSTATSTINATSTPSTATSTATSTINATSTGSTTPIKIPPGKGHGKKGS